MEQGAGGVLLPLPLVGASQVLAAVHAGGSIHRQLLGVHTHHVGVQVSGVGTHTGMGASTGSGHDDSTKAKKRR